MFNVVTGRRKRRIWSPTTIAASVAVHVLLLGGAVYGATAAPAPEAEVPLVDIGPPPEVEKPKPVEPTPPPPQDDEPVTAPPKVGTTLVFQPPIDVPKVLPPVDLDQTPIEPKDASGVGVPGDVIGPPTDDPTPATGDPAPPARGGEWIPGTEAVEEQPVLDRANLQSLLERYYPTILRNGRVEGRVDVEFVVNEDGRVRRGSAVIVSATHPAFGDATLRAVERMRFRPARIGGDPVPVRVTLPIVWSIAH
ncbi:MAG TPA: TonB family protein [Longimicrobium sp.]|nr:TonB family protein [Longimicrobium sp.]